ncbi:MAG: hypothetical protein H6985_04685 [Pseudomonadales bacterium]|nr:hypothetical protein [Halioglobus sp.]MCP5128866.1 hypothetical protein [Pseudomonadales bacterium]
MKNVFAVLAFTTLLASVSFQSSAVTIYDEAVDGDLDAIGTTNVNLVAGVNTILASINQTPPAETDRIRFTQVTGLIVDSIVLSFALPFDDFNIGQNMSSDLHNDVANLFDDNFGAINSGDSISASFYDSFGPETGPISQDTAGAIWDFQLSAGTVYPGQPWTLTIYTSLSPVPVPAAAWLFGSALLLLAGIKRNKTRRSGGRVQESRYRGLYVI